MGIEPQLHTYLYLPEMIQRLHTRNECMQPLLCCYLFTLFFRYGMSNEESP